MTSNRFDLRGKVAIVTGGNGGIGLGLAHGLADAGADIAVVGRNEAKSKALGCFICNPSWISSTAVSVRHWRKPIPCRQSPEGRWVNESALRPHLHANP